MKLLATGNEMFPNFPGVVVAVLGSFADKNPAVVDDLVKSIVRATQVAARTIRSGPRRSSAPLSARVSLPDDILEAAIRSPQTKFTSDPRRIIEATAKLQDYQVKLGALEKAAPLGRLVRALRL